MVYIMLFKYCEAKDTSASFIAYPSTAALSYRKSAGTSLDTEVLRTAIKEKVERWETTKF